MVYEGRHRRHTTSLIPKDVERARAIAQDTEKKAAEIHVLRTGLEPD